jgi:glucosyl-dolichyl phosphate glucuronosyltransferase
MFCNFSVIICAYTEKRWHEIVAAVESVRQQSLPAHEIIVVVDHNKQLLRRVQEYIPGVVVVENTGAVGLSGARNSGIAAAQGAFLAFLDDDAVATPDWLLHLSEGFADPEVLGVGGPVIPLWQVDRPSWVPDEFLWVVGCSYHGMPEVSCIIRNPIGANMAFRREVFAAVGGFHEGIGRIGTRPLGCEETELCIRARQCWPDRGFLYQLQAAVLHHVPATRAQWSYFFSRCYSEGLSKAFISRYVGTHDGLSSERTYTCKVLPLGVLCGLGDALLHRDFTGFARAWAIGSGLAATVAGYLVGKFGMAKSAEHAAKQRATYPGSQAVYTDQEQDYAMLV